MGEEFSRVSHRPVAVASLPAPFRARKTGPRCVTASIAVTAAAGSGAVLLNGTPHPISRIGRSAVHNGSFESAAVTLGQPEEQKPAAPGLASRRLATPAGRLAALAAHRSRAARIWTITRLRPMRHCHAAGRSVTLLQWWLIALVSGRGTGPRAGSKGRSRTGRTRAAPAATDRTVR